MYFVLRNNPDLDVRQTTSRPLDLSTLFDPRGIQICQHFRRQFACAALRRRQAAE